MRANDQESPAPEPDTQQPTPEEANGISASFDPEADADVTAASEQSFPASDPPPWTSSATRSAWPETEG